MTIVNKPLAELREPEKNIRRHTEKQLKEYVRSLRMFGQIKPIVIDETGEIIAGNGLYEALKSMGAESCDCYVVNGLTGKQKKKLMLADNRVYELGITDTDIFEELIRELDGDIDVPGWDTDLLEMLSASAAEANDMIERYGVYDPQEVAAVRHRERSEHMAHPEGPVSTDTAAVPAWKPTESYVVCPKCGERICL